MYTVFVLVLRGHWLVFVIFVPSGAIKTIAEIRFGLLQIKRIYDINKTLVIGTCMLFL